MTTIEKFKTALRPCIVQGRKALFHEWNHISQIRDAVLIGTVSGVISDTFGIVEFEDGTVTLVYPREIRFVGDKIKEYSFGEGQ